MHFNHVLDEQLQNQYSFRGVECSVQVQDRFQEYAFLGYCLKDCFSLEGESVQAGLLIAEGKIVGVAYRTGEDFHKELFPESLFLDGFTEAVIAVVRLLVHEHYVGSQDWVSIASMEEYNARIQNTEMIVRNKAGKPMILGCVLVETSLGTEFFTMLFGKSEDFFIIALAKYIQPSTYQMSFEAVFSDPSKGNEIFKKVKNSKFVSKKKNIIYRLEKQDFFQWFKSVKEEPVLEVW